MDPLERQGSALGWVGLAALIGGGPALGQKNGCPGNAVECILLWSEWLDNGEGAPRIIEGAWGGRNRPFTETPPPPFYRWGTEACPQLGNESAVALELEQVSLLERHPRADVST